MGTFIDILPRVFYRLVVFLNWIAEALANKPQLHTARFAKPHELEGIQARAWDNETSLLLGVSPFHQVLSVRTSTQRRELGNVLVVAPTRGGKGLLAVSQLLTWPHSVIVNDIKGELYDQTAEYRRRQGNRILVIDPTGVGNQYDPLHARSTERELYASAKYLLYEAGERDSIFIERGMKMLTQLFRAAREENRQAGFDKYRLLPYAGKLMDLPLNQLSAHLQAVSPDLTTKFLSGAYTPQKDYDEKKFLTSSWESVTARLYPVLSEELLACFDGSDFTGADIITGDRPVTVYLRWPEAELLALSPVVRLVWQSLIHELITTYDRLPGRTASEKGCQPVLLLLDEAGRSAIHQLYDYAATVVGRGISLWVAIQSIAQLDAIYGKANAQVLRDNMDSQIFYRPKQETADYLEHALGRKSDYAHSSTSRQGGGESLGLSEQGVPLMSADEIKQLEDAEIVLFHGKLRPVRARRMNWREHPVLRHRQALLAPRLPPLPPLTTVALRRLQTTASDDLINPDEPFKRKK